MTDYQLPVSFYFKVIIDKVSIPLSFKEVSGLTTERELENVQEGGVNNFEHKLPKQAKHNNLILKRALSPVKNQDVLWIKHIMEGDFAQAIVPRNIQVQLMNPKKEPIYTWFCTKAYPVKWEVEALDSEKNSVLIENIEFAYQTLIRS